MSVTTPSTDDVSTATYHDTPDGRLARAGIALRRRMANGVGVWEAEIAGRAVSEAGGPAELPARLADLLRVPLRDAELVAIARLREGPSDVALLEGQHVVRTYPDLERALKDAREAARLSPPGKRAPALEHVRAYLQRQLAEIERTDPILRSIDDDEALHDLRVAVRRTRAILRAARELFDEEWVTSLRSELKWLGGELSPVRELDVLLAELRAEPESDTRPVVKALEAKRRQARKKAIATLAGERYFALVHALAGAVEHPPVRTTEVSLPALAADEFERLRDWVARLGKEPTDDALHRARIAAKRARYAAELAAPFSGSRAARFVSAAKDFQDVVGAHQDAVAASGWIRAVVSGSADPATAFAAGRLVERQERRRAKARGDFREAWRRLERRGRKAWS